MNITKKIERASKEASELRQLGGTYTQLRQRASKAYETADSVSGSSGASLESFIGCLGGV